MKLGMVGLGRMGSGMTERLRRDGHEVMTYDPKVESTAGRSRSSPRSSSRRGQSGSWSRRASRRRPSSASCSGSLESGDTIVDGGNSNFHDSKRRSAEASEHGIDFVDVGVSGGVWGLTEGFCLMAGGPDEPVKRLEPVLSSLAPEDGWAHVGPSGAGHFVKMVHNGIEYGLMQSYGEGFEIMHASEYDLDFDQISGIWRYGSVVRSWLLELLHDAFAEHGGDLSDIAGYVADSGEGRWTVDAAINENVPTPAMTMALFMRFASRAGRVVRCEGQRGTARAVRRSRGEDEMTDTELAETLCSRARPAASPRAVRDGHLRRLRGSHQSQDLPGSVCTRVPATAARALRRRRHGETRLVRREFRNRMENAVREFARDDFKQEVWDRLAEATHFLSMDFADESGEDALAERLSQLDEERGTRGNRVYYLAVPPAAMPTIVEQLGKRRKPRGLGPAHHREAVRARPRPRRRSSRS